MCAEGLVLERASNGATAAERRGPSPGGRAIRLLCAEDNRINRQLLEALLSPLEAELVMVENGLEAVRAWERQEFDLILMDIQMPVLDGLTASAEIRARERSAGRTWTPIVAVTANAGVEETRNYFEAGMDAVVPKPVAPAVLYEAIATTLTSTVGVDATSSARRATAGPVTV